MGIEVLYTRIGKEAPGIIGQSTNTETVNVWAYNLNACSNVAKCLQGSICQWKTNLVPIICTKRRKNPEFHMISLTEIFCVKKWKFSLISLMPLNMRGELVNVVTGKINNDLGVNIDDSFRFGEDQMKNNSKKSSWWIL